jgi:hypothetical protein
VIKFSWNLRGGQGNLASLLHGRKQRTREIRKGKEEHEREGGKAKLPTPISNGGLTAAAPPQCAKSARGGDPTPKKQYR